jgi:ATP synthase protein I
MQHPPEEKPFKKKRLRGDFARFLGVASTIGINLVISTFMGFAIGYFLLDRYVFPELFSFNTFPWFTIIFLLLGIAAGFRYLFIIAKKAGEDRSSDINRS